MFFVVDGGSHLRRVRCLYVRAVLNDVLLKTKLRPDWVTWVLIWDISFIKTQIQDLQGNFFGLV